MPRMRAALGGGLVVLLLAATAALAGYYPRPAFHGVDHGAAIDCWDCHWFDSENAFNASHVSPLITGAGGFYSVGYSGYADMAKPDHSGVCQVCHTQTKYWGATYDGPRVHFRGEDCLSCHPHWQPEDLFRPQMRGPQSHATHLTDPKGPRLADCTDCHSEGDYSIFADGQPLATTGICDICHSAGGPVDGVNDPVVGAKPNWLHGVYDGNQLKPGLEHWCDGCHDSGTSVVKGVQAPNVLGDNVTWGYNVSGHGRDPDDFVKCLDCHAATYEHCDGDQRTYVSNPAVFPGNYQSGYRLAVGLNIPRSWARDGRTTDYNLCLSCHDSNALFSASGIMRTNFRNDRSWVFASKNLHLLHLIKGPFSHGPLWDSDWNGVTGSDSPASCPACHNVHGSPTPAMTRHGELMGLGSLGLDFRYYKLGGAAETTDLLESRWGASELDYSSNKICIGCHGNYSDRYFRVPYQVLVPDPTQLAPQPLYNGLVWASDLANNPKTKFHKSDSLKVHCVYYVCPFAPDPPYEVTRSGNVSGAFAQNLAKDVAYGQMDGVYEVTWTTSVPAGATAGDATIKVVVKTLLRGLTYSEPRTCTIKVTN
jgi:hypothetical protein